MPQLSPRVCTGSPIRKNRCDKKFEALMEAAARADRIAGGMDVDGK
jgi:hypothetical protein